MELDGGYECNCTDGYYLEDDGVTCKGIIYSSTVYVAIHGRCVHS